MAEYITTLEMPAVPMRLGVYPHEAVPQRVRLSVRMTVSYPEPVSVDRIEEVLDYDFVREGIRAIAEGPGFGLQEMLCDTVAALCLRDPRVSEVRVRSAKLDVYPDAEVGCEVTRHR